MSIKSQFEIIFSCLKIKKALILISVGLIRSTAIILKPVQDQNNAALTKNKAYVYTVCVYILHAIVLRTL